MTMLPNGRRAGGTKAASTMTGDNSPTAKHVAAVTTLVPDALSETACRLWASASDTYYRKGGIVDSRAALEELNTGANSLSMGMLGLGQQCLTHAKDDTKQASILFAGACAMAEKRAKAAATEAKEKDTSIAKLLPIWAPNKTVIVRALDKGINLNARDDKGHLKYPTITPVREAIRTPRGTKGAGTQTGPGTFTFTPQLAASVDQLYKELAALSELGQNKASEDVLILCVKVREYRDQTGSEQAHAALITPIATEAIVTPAEKREKQKRGGSKAA